MSVPRSLAWLLLGATLLTAGLLRQFHSETPRSPFVSPLVGSLLFAAVFLLLLAAAREWRLGPSPGRGVRFGSLAPILLMLLVEKWISIGLYLAAVSSGVVPSPTGERYDHSRYTSPRGFRGNAFFTASESATTTWY